MPDKLHQTMPCVACGKAVDLSGLPYQKRYNSIHGRRRVFCSEECAKKSGNYWTEERREKSRQMMTALNKKNASGRMKAHNPMQDPAIRERMKNTLKEIGHKPAIRGGNGKGPTEPQLMLMNALKKFYPEMEYAIPTKIPKGNGYPTCYKVDIAIPDAMVAVEVDGFSHCSLERQMADRKKEELLSSYGWKVLRFMNRQVTEHLEECVQTVECTIFQSNMTTTTLQME